MLPKFADGVWVIELAPLADPDFVPVTVATELGLDLADNVVSPERVANALAAKQLLLVLDNCEHLVGAAASIAEAVLRANPAARVLATSREPLRAEGECLYRVPSLAVPTEGSRDAEDPLRYGAVRLFVARARAAEPQFSPDGRVAAAIAAICRHLDGIPLAIELAAARTNALGVEELAARLDDCFHLLTGGRRTALPRHQTLRATLDWSYQLLPEPERVVLRRPAFTGGVEPSANFLNDFNRRGIVCDQHDFYLNVLYTQQRIDASDDATCRSYGLAPGADAAYANCRLELRAQRTGAAQTQHVIQAQQEADRAAAWRNLSTTGATLMQQSQPPPPPPPKDTYCVQAGTGISCRTQ